MSHIPSSADSNLHLLNDKTKNYEAFVTMGIADQMFGIPVLQVQDVLAPQKITHVPLAPREVLGSLNLRGRIVTAVDIRLRLSLPPRAADADGMSVVVEHNSELYSLIVDRVGEVISLPLADYEKNPATLDPQWQDISKGIYRLQEGLLIALDVPKILRIESHAAK